MKHGLYWRGGALLVLGFLTGTPHPPQAAASPPMVALDTPAPLAPAPEIAPAPQCDGGQDSPPEVVASTARQLSSRRIAYRSQPMSDCSGMFHRVLQSLHSRCDDILGPTPEQARSSDAIARWYDAQGALHRVRTPEQADPWLVPGAILFYATPGARGDLAAIHHVGVVVDVVRDAQDRVDSYRLFHGRQPGLTATITSHHTRDNRPVLGNGPDALVAIASAW